MRVLLVDDDPAGRQALAWFLKRQQHEVDECADGAAALRLYVQGEYPLVLADVQMPGMSGVDLAAAIKKCRKAGGLMSCWLLDTLTCNRPSALCGQGFMITWRNRLTSRRWPVQ